MWNTRLGFQKCFAQTVSTNRGMTRMEKNIYYLKIPFGRAVPIRVWVLCVILSKMARLFTLRLFAGNWIANLWKRFFHRVYDNGRENAGWFVSRYWFVWPWARPFPTLETGHALASRDRHGSVFLEVTVSHPGRLALLHAPRVFRQGSNTRFGERVLRVGKQRGRCLCHNGFVLAPWNADIEPSLSAPRGICKRDLSRNR